MDDEGEDVWEPAPYRVPALVSAPSSAAGSSTSGTVPFDEILERLDKARDGKDIALAMRVALAKSIAYDLYNDKIGAGDKIKLLGSFNDRVDGKVADTVSIKVTVADEAVGAITELLRSGVLTRDIAVQQARDLGLSDIGFIDAVLEEV